MQPHMMYQPPQPPELDPWTKVLILMRFAAKLPFIALGIVAAAMGGWVLFWFIVRLCTYCYREWLDKPWN